MILDITCAGGARKDLMRIVVSACHDLSQPYQAARLYQGVLEEPLRKEKGATSELRLAMTPRS